MHIAQAAPKSPFVRLQSFERTLPSQIAIALLATIFVAVCAHVSVPLPFTPVPLTLGNFAVVLVGFALGPSTAFAAMILYLSEGALGLPVFNPGGPGGLAQLLGPTGGFLFSYPFCALVSGYAVRRLRPICSGFFSAAWAYALATAVVLACGAAWLGIMLHLSPKTALGLGILPFLPGEMVKMIAGAGLYSTLDRRTYKTV